MKYMKINGAGNDFIIINNMEEKLPLEKFTYIAKRLCQRRLSIGADGLMVIDRSELDADFKMIFYNADGSLGEMCGNGARCIARYGYEKGLSGEVQRIETHSGVIEGWRIDKRNYRIMLNPPTLVKLDHNLSIDGIEYESSYVELGSPGLPHLVVRCDNMDDIPKEEFWKLGNKLRHDKSFPKGANINFYKIIADDEVFVKTFERGVEDFTLACGTGAGSLALVLSLLEKTHDQTRRIHVPGGILDVEVVFKDEDSTEIYLTGPTNMVSEGQVMDEELEY